jgi:dipeptidyl aminopeptidase/acylaminoacyl peptidase
LFSTELQLYAAAGFVVVYSNPRGSTSYGDAFANEIELNWPGHDYDDLMSVVDAALAKGFLDPQRLYVTGGSAGGLMTAWIVGNTQRFRAAVAEKPVINFQTELLTSDRYVGLMHSWFDKMPWEDPSGYWARSPLSRVGKVSTPTMLMVGEQDYRTPPSEAEQFYQALQLRAVPTSLVLIPGAGHLGPTRPSLTAARVGATLGWFRRFDSAGTEEGK